MKLHIAHLYPDLLNSYGDIGNIRVLVYRAKKRGIDVEVHSVSVGDIFDDSLYDLVLFGGGQDFEQTIVAEDLKNTKRDALKRYIENKKVLIAICGGYQLLGNYYLNQENVKVPGLSLIDVSTSACETRFIGDLVVESPFGTLVGFENHSGETLLGDVQPLGKVIHGFGNGKSGYEGCIHHHTYGTYLHGPLLAKNPEFADHLIKTACDLKGIDVTMTSLDDTFEHEAKKQVLQRMNKARK